MKKEPGINQGPEEQEPGEGPEEPEEGFEEPGEEFEMPGEGFDIAAEIESYELTPEDLEEITEATHLDPVLEDELEGARNALEQRLFPETGLLDVQAEAPGPAGLRNIVAVGVGEKEVSGQPTGRLAVKVYVIEKVSPEGIASEALVPHDVQGVATDVEGVGEIEALRFTSKYRPARTGVSVGHPRVTAGTLGALVVAQNRLCILSNNHVLANSNNARRGDPILQPGHYDGGRYPRDLIARLLNYISIDFSGRCTNLVDAAVAYTSSRLVRPFEMCGWRPKRSIISAPLPGLSVKKCGRTTQFTRGRVSAIRATVRVRYGSRIACFRDQVLISPGGFSAGGDSGSLIVSDTYNRPVGLLFAGSSRVTVANRIYWVLRMLRARMY